MDTNIILLALSPTIALLVQMLKNFGVDAKYAKFITMVLSLSLAMIFSFNKPIFDILVQWISVAAAAVGSYELVIKPVAKKTTK